MTKYIQDLVSQNELSIQNNSQKKVENISGNKEIKNKMKTIIASLSEQKRTIIALYYYEKLTPLDISKVLGLSEIKISQILDQTLNLIIKKSFINN